MSCPLLSCTTIKVKKMSKFSIIRITNSGSKGYLERAWIVLAGGEVVAIYPENFNGTDCISNPHHQRAVQQQRFVGILSLEVTAAEFKSLKAQAKGMQCRTTGEINSQLK